MGGLYRFVMLQYTFLTLISLSALPYIIPSAEITSEPRPNIQLSSEPPPLGVQGISEDVQDLGSQPGQPQGPDESKEPPPMDIQGISEHSEDPQPEPSQPQGPDEGPMSEPEPPTEEHTESPSNSESEPTHQSELQQKPADALQPQASPGKISSDPE